MKPRILGLGRDSDYEIMRLYKKTRKIKSAVKTVNLYFTNLDNRFGSFNGVLNQYTNEQIVNYFEENGLFFEKRRSFKAKRARIIGG